jgi:hypothetical protein
MTCQLASAMVVSRAGLIRKDWKIAARDARREDRK